MSSSLPYTKEEFLAMVEREQQTPLDENELERRINNKFLEYSRMAFREYIVHASALDRYRVAAHKLMYSKNQ